MPTHHRERRRTINASAGSEHPSPKRANAKTASLGPEHPTSWISLHATQHEVLNTAQNEGPGCFGKVLGWPWVTSRGPRGHLGPGQFLGISLSQTPRRQHPPLPPPPNRKGFLGREPFRNKAGGSGGGSGPGGLGKVLGWPCVTSPGPRGPLGPGQFLRISAPQTPRWQQPPPQPGRFLGREPFRNKVGGSGGGSPQSKRPFKRII